MSEPEPEQASAPRSEAPSAKARDDVSPRKQELVVVPEEVPVPEAAQEAVERAFDADSAGVRDRWSRYIGAMGIDAVRRQTASSVFVGGLRGLGAEVAKNVVLSGVRRLTLHDPGLVQEEDLGSQFFLRSADMGLARAAASVRRIQELNFYVRVDVHDEPLDQTTIPMLKDYNVVILTDSPLALCIAVNEFCRTNGIQFIWAGVRGVFAHVFVDLGPSFEVLDRDGL